MRRRLNIFGIGAGFFLLAAALGVGLGINWSGDKKEERTLPQVEINLTVSLEDFRNGNKTDEIANNILEIRDLGGPTQEFNGVELRGRGNLTWVQEKKPFQIKLKKAEDLLGLGKAKKWVFLADSVDASHLRNHTAFTLAEWLDEGYARRGKFVELAMNGEWQGLYYVVRKVEIGRGALELRDELGIMVEIDNLHRADETCYDIDKGYCLIIKDAVSAKDEEKTDAAMADFLEAFAALVAAAEERDYEAVEAVADTESLAKYYLVNEFANNPDAWSASFYWHKDGVEDVLHAGPVWDFDLALGNSQWDCWTEDANYNDPEGLEKRKNEALGIGRERDGNIVGLFFELLEMPEFREEVARVYREKLQGRKEELLITMRQTAGLIRAAAVADSERWGEHDFDTEVEELIRWTERRFDVLAEEFGENAESDVVLAPGVV